MLIEFDHKKHYTKRASRPAWARGLKLCKEHRKIQRTE
jgi:hypothetical protein